MSEHHEGYAADELGQYVDALSKNVIAYTQRHPMQAAIDTIDKYCDGHHSALDGCECAILIALIKGEQIDHLGEAIRATAWAYTEGEQPNPLIKGES